MMGGIPLDTPKKAWPSHFKNETYTTARGRDGGNPEEDSGAIAPAGAGRSSFMYVMYVVYVMYVKYVTQVVCARNVCTFC